MLETRAAAIQEKCDDQNRDDQPDRSDSPAGTHPPIETAAAAKQNQENYDYEYGIHRCPCFGTSRRLMLSHPVIAPVPQLIRWRAEQM